MPMTLDNGLRDIYHVIFPYVDCEFYRAMYGEIEDPVLHYIENWEQMTFDPCRFFSTSYYHENNSDVAKAKLNPLFHYVMHGQRERRLPCDPISIQAKLSPHNMDDPSINFSNWELPCILSKEKIKSTPYKDTAQLLDALKDTKASALLFNQPSSKDWFIYFSGRNENFHLLNKTKNSNVNILILRDKEHMYYCSGKNLPEIDKLESYLNYFTGKRIGKTVIAGQSYGGYCALYQSTKIKNTISFAFSPQAFHPTLTPYNITFQKGINKLSPKPTPNLIDAISAADEQSRYVIVGLTEHRHVDSYYWGDLLSAGLLAATGKVSIIVVNQHEHSTLRYLNGEQFLGVIFENYTLFESSQQKAAALLSSSAIYYEKIIETTN